MVGSNFNIKLEESNTETILNLELIWLYLRKFQHQSFKNTLTMKKYAKIYKELRKKYSDQEIA